MRIGSGGDDERASIAISSCVNAEIDPASFLTPDKYLRPSFVYAGSLHAWQCFDLGWAPLSVQVWRSLHIWYEKLMLSRYINDAG